jgi:hypothetical protein
MMNSYAEWWRGHLVMTARKLLREIAAVSGIQHGAYWNRRTGYCGLIDELVRREMVVAT